MDTSAIPTFSVVTPVHNAEQFLLRTAESLFMQDFSHWEWLLVDDGSTDNSPAILAALAARDVRVRVFSHPGRTNLGVSASRNLALAHARAPWVAILDADDMAAPGRLGGQFQLLEAHAGLHLCWGRARLVNDQDQDLSVDPWGGAPVWGRGPPTRVEGWDPILQDDVMLPSPTVVVRREALVAVGGFDVVSAPGGARLQVEDWVAWARVLRRGAGLFEPALRARYRVHPASYSSRHTPETHHMERLVALHHLAAVEGVDAALGLALVRQWRRIAGLPGSPLRRASRAASALSLGVPRGTCSTGTALAGWARFRRRWKVAS